MMKPTQFAAAALTLIALNASGQQYYQSKTPYLPRQTMSSYEQAPSGYRAVYTEMLARHGSRGLTGMKADLALYNLWLQAQKSGGLTPLGEALGADILEIMKANFLLGYGVPGISKPGYGNETMQGIDEHTQLAHRLRQRLPELFDTAGQRKIIVVTSGKDRAVDSGFFFVSSLLAEQPDLASTMAYPPSLAPRTEQDHSSRPTGTDRFLLYFHKLSAKQDQVGDSSDPLYAGYQASVAYQSYARSADLRAREHAILAQPRLAAAAKIVLERLFTPAFVAELDQGRHTASNTGSYSYTSSDGKFTNTLDGEGDDAIKTSGDAALALYELYSAAADMRAEVSADFARYMPSMQAAVFASVDDAVSFYAKGPGGAESGDVTYRMAQTLLNDFFGEVDAIAKGDMSHAAKLRFAHAETVIPMASILGVPGMAQQQPAGLPYQYENNPWRGELVAPMAANIQWDVYINGKGGTLVRMLYNEKETDFKPACIKAKIKPGSHFYDYAGLKACYGHTSQAPGM